jgi:hypothetical protein
VCVLGGVVCTVMQHTCILCKGSDLGNCNMLQHHFNTISTHDRAIRRQGVLCSGDIFVHCALLVRAI